MYQKNIIEIFNFKIEKNALEELNRCIIYIGNVIIHNVTHKKLSEFNLLKTIKSLDKPSYFYDFYNKNNKLLSSYMNIETVNKLIEKEEKTITKNGLLFLSSFIEYIIFYLNEKLKSKSKSKINIEQVIPVLYDNIPSKLLPKSNFIYDTSSKKFVLKTSVKGKNIIKNQKKVYNKVSNKLVKLGFDKYKISKNNIVKIIFIKVKNKELLGDDYVNSLETLKEYIMDFREPAIDFGNVEKLRKNFWRISLYI